MIYYLFNNIFVTVIAKCENSALIIFPTIKYEYIDVDHHTGSIPTTLKNKNPRQAPAFTSIRKAIQQSNIHKLGGNRNQWSRSRRTLKHKHRVTARAKTNDTIH
jgi:hypothetical protein